MRYEAYINGKWYDQGGRTLFTHMQWRWERFNRWRGVTTCFLLAVLTCGKGHVVRVTR